MCVLGGLLAVDAVVEVVGDLVLVIIIVIVSFPSLSSPLCCHLRVAPTSTLSLSLSLC